MSISCKDAIQLLLELKKSLEFYESKIQEYALMGDEVTLKMLKMQTKIIELEAKSLREQLEKTTTYDRAKEIMGDRFVGYEGSKELNIEFIISGKTENRIPFSEAELIEAKRKNAVLIFRPSHYNSDTEEDFNSEKLTPNKIFELLSQKPRKLGHLKTFDQLASHKSIKLIMQIISGQPTALDPPKYGWALVHPEPVDPEIPREPSESIPSLSEMIYDSMFSEHIFDMMASLENEQFMSSSDCNGRGAFVALTMESRNGSNRFRVDVADNAHTIHTYFQEFRPVRQ